MLHKLAHVRHYPSIRLFHFARSDKLHFPDRWRAQSTCFGRWSTPVAVTGPHGQLASFFLFHTVMDYMHSFHSQLSDRVPTNFSCVSAWPVQLGSLNYTTSILFHQFSPISQICLFYAADLWPHARHFRRPRSPCAVAMWTCICKGLGIYYRPWSFSKAGR